MKLSFTPMGSQVREVAERERPACACHGEPMWRGGKSGWVCRVKEGARNAERIRVGADAVFVGRSHKFGTSKENVKRFIARTREEHLAQSQ